MMQGEICIRILSLGLIGHLIVSTDGFRPFPQWHARHLRKLNFHSSPLNYRGRTYDASMNSVSRSDFFTLNPSLYRQPYRMVPNYRPLTPFTPNLFVPLTPPPILPRRRRRPLQIVYLAPVPNSLTRTPVSPPVTRPHSLPMSRHPLPLSRHPFPHPPPPPPSARSISPKLLWLYMSHVPVVPHNHHSSFHNFIPLPVVKRPSPIGQNFNSLIINNTTALSKVPAPILENSTVAVQPSLNISQPITNQENSPGKTINSVISSTAKPTEFNSSTTDAIFYETYELAEASTKGYDYSYDNETATVELPTRGNKVPNKRKAENPPSNTLIFEENFTPRNESEDNSRTFTTPTTTMTAATTVATKSTTIASKSTRETTPISTKSTRETVSTIATKSTRKTTTRAPFRLKDAISWRKERSSITPRSKETTTASVNEAELVPKNDHTTPSSSAIENESLVLHDDIVEASSEAPIDTIESLSLNISEPINEDVVMTNISLIHPLGQNMSVVISQRISPSNDSDLISHSNESERLEEASTSEGLADGVLSEDGEYNSTTVADESSSDIESSTPEDASGERFSRSQELKSRKMSKKSEFGRRILVPGVSKRKGAKNEGDIERQSLKMKASDGKLDALVDEEEAADEDGGADDEAADNENPPEEDEEREQKDEAEEEQEETTEGDDSVYKEEEYYSDDYDNADENLTTDEYTIPEDDNYEDSSPQPEK